ncbi:uncharacterized protein SCHCODRAFT_02628216 [Schizophyllum commune H4-8]|nr:uncharacterized protein SCHCODRAFT_02628216 [Schizophyllum commune H4-8]KAI5891149.1 hypothetical protein SCHCODRAFT_02628216 [Schizophyllum commune H4-8]
MFQFEDRFRQSGNQELNSLQDALNELIKENHTTVPRALHRQIKSILTRGSAFCLLEGAPPFGRPLSEVHEHNDMLRAILHSFAILGHLYNVLGSTSGQSTLLDKPPVALDKLFRWIDFMHPMHGYAVGTYPSDSDRHEAVPVCAILGGIISSSDNGKEYIDRFVQQQPRAIALILDLWLFYPKYLRGQERNIGSSQYVSDGILGLLRLLYSTEGLHDIFTAELTRLVDGRLGRVSRCIAAHTNFLVQAQAKGALIAGSTWETHFCAAHGMLAYLTASMDIHVRRSAFTSSISGARLCLANRDDPLSLEAARHAVKLLSENMTGLRSLRQTVRALQGDILDLMIELPSALRGDESIVKLARHLQDSLWCPSVLRAFRKSYDALVLRGALDETALADPMTRDLASRFKLYWKTYAVFRQDRGWKRAVPCYGRAEDDHGEEVKPCPCGKVFYCSVECQRIHWEAEHRDDCCYRDAGAFGLHGAVKLESLFFLGRCAQEALKRHADWVGSTYAAHTRINPTVVPCLWVSFADNLDETTEPSGSEDSATSVDAYGCVLSTATENNRPIDTVLPEGWRIIAVQVRMRVGMNVLSQALPFLFTVEGEIVEGMNQPLC